MRLVFSLGCFSCRFPATLLVPCQLLMVSLCPSFVLERSFCRLYPDLTVHKLAPENPLFRKSCLLLYCSGDYEESALSYSKCLMSAKTMTLGIKQTSFKFLITYERTKTNDEFRVHALFMVDAFYHHQRWNFWNQWNG